MHKVKCYYCGQTFDRDKEPTIQVSARRYAHKECAEKVSSQESKEQQELNNLIAYIQKLFQNNYIEAKIRRQIKTFKKDYNYTYLGMHQSLFWFFEIQNGSIEKANGGIGIIPYVYNSAMEYFQKLAKANQLNQNKTQIDFARKVKKITIPYPTTRTKEKKLFDLGEVENE